MVEDSKGNPREELFSCPRCSASTTSGEIVTPLRLARSAPLAVLTEELYRQTPASSDPIITRKAGQGRKLLTFADSRQGAARYAAYLQATVNETLYRHLIARAAQDLNGSGRIPDLEELAERCVYLAERYGLFGENPHNATAAERRRRLVDARARIASEFCARTDPRHSLWALGFVGCDIHFAETEKPGDSLCRMFGLSTQGVMTVTQALLDTMRLDKAVTMPEGVTHDDEVFGRNRATSYYRITDAVADRNERSWINSRGIYARRQSRFDYVRRILRAENHTVEFDDVANVLQAVWNWVQGQDVFAGQQGSYQIKSSRLIFPTNGDWHRCNRCLRLSRRLISPDVSVCPSRGCDGTLEPCSPDRALAENHYRLIFDRSPIGMRAEEHTAQLQPELGRTYQEQFTSGDINILSCSTTFELGVDVGELQTIVLNNVPPTVANYRQRSGRAGRRAGGTAFILTYAAARPHDRVYFSDPSRIIAGEVSIPSLGVTNPIISSRHLNAMLLSHFLRYLVAQGRVDLNLSGPFFAPNFPNGRHFDFLEQWRKDSSEHVTSIVDRFFAENRDASSETADACVDRLVTDLASKCSDFEHWLREYERLRNHYTRIADESTDRKEQAAAERMRKRFNNLRLRLLDERLIDFLCREGVLPSYSFPIDVVDLQLPRDQQYREGRFVDKSLRLERDKKLAIVEYAPGAEVVADKHIWKSVGVIIRQELNTYAYRVCGVCQDLDRSTRGGLPIGGACRVCGSLQPPQASGNYVDPDGFTTSLTAPLREARTQVDYGVNRSRSFLLATGQGVEQRIPVNGEPRIHYAYRRDGELVALNSGGDPNGFWLCDRCGIEVPQPTRRRSGGRRKTTGHETPWGEKGCGGIPAQYHLGHAFKSDTLHLRFENTANVSIPPGTDVSFWRSLTYALLEGASLAMQIERRDLDGVVRPFSVGVSLNPEENFSQEVVLFDNVPGGAGHVRRVADNLRIRVAACSHGCSVHRMW